MSLRDSLLFQTLKRCGVEPFYGYKPFLSHLESNSYSLSKFSEPLNPLVRGCVLVAMGFLQFSLSPYSISSLMPRRAEKLFFDRCDPRLFLVCRLMLVHCLLSVTFSRICRLISGSLSVWKNSGSRQ